MSFILRESLRRRNLALFAIAIILLFIAFVLVQFHCLDCGATGWLLRSRTHACPAVVARRQIRLVRRFRGPGLKLQLVVWFIILMAALVIGTVALRS
jgi:hypothetical protein